MHTSVIFCQRLVGHHRKGISPKVPMLRSIRARRGRAAARTARACLVRLHGKGETAARYRTVDGLEQLDRHGHGFRRRR